MKKVRQAQRTSESASHLCKLSFQSTHPGVEQRIFTREDRSDRLLNVIGPEGSDVVKVHQDASVHVASLTPGAEVAHPIGSGRGAYAYLIEGATTFNGEGLATGDAVKVVDEPQLTIRADQASELILVDVPMSFEPVGIWRLAF